MNDLPAAANVPLPSAVIARSAQARGGNPSLASTEVIAGPEFAAMDCFAGLAMTPNVQQPNSRAANVLSPHPSLRGASKTRHGIHLWTDLRRRLAGCKPAMDCFAAFAMTIRGVVRFGASRRGWGRCLRANTASSPSITKVSRTRATVDDDVSRLCQIARSVQPSPEAPHARPTSVQRHL